MRLCYAIIESVRIAVRFPMLAYLRDLNLGLARSLHGTLHGVAPIQTEEAAEGKEEKKKKGSYEERGKKMGRGGGRSQWGAMREQFEERMERVRRAGRGKGRWRKTALDNGKEEDE